VGALLGVAQRTVLRLPKIFIRLRCCRLEVALLKGIRETDVHTLFHKSRRTDAVQKIQGVFQSTLDIEWFDD
jgi:hypothetical protein